MFLVDLRTENLLTRATKLRSDLAFHGLLTIY